MDPLPLVSLACIYSGILLCFLTLSLTKKHGYKLAPAGLTGVVLISTGLAIYADTIEYPSLYERQTVETEEEA